jgi:hypothetical protein
MFPIKSPRDECISSRTLLCDDMTHRAQSTALEVESGTHSGVCSATPSQVRRKINGTCKDLWWSTQTVLIISQSHILVCDICLTGNCGDLHCILNFFRLIHSGGRMIRHRPASGRISMKFSYPVISSRGFLLNIDLQHSLPGRVVLIFRLVELPCSRIRLKSNIRWSL